MVVVGRVPGCNILEHSGLGGCLFRGGPTKPLVLRVCCFARNGEVDVANEKKKKKSTNVD